MEKSSFFVSELKKLAFQLGPMRRLSTENKVKRSDPGRRCRPARRRPRGFLKFLSFGDFKLQVLDSRMSKSSISEVRELQNLIFLRSRTSKLQVLEFRNSKASSFGENDLGYKSWLGSTPRAQLKN